MYDAQSVDYGLKHPVSKKSLIFTFSFFFKARCVEAIIGDEENHRFVVGTCAVNEQNELHLLDFVEDTNEIVCKGIYTHPNEVVHITPCPKDPNLLFTCGKDCTSNGMFFCHFVVFFQNDKNQKKICFIRIKLFSVENS